MSTIEKMALCGKILGNPQIHGYRLHVRTGPGLVYRSQQRRPLWSGIGAVGQRRSQPCRNLEKDFLVEESDSTTTKAGKPCAPVKEGTEQGCLEPHQQQACLRWPRSCLYQQWGNSTCEKGKRTFRGAVAGLRVNLWTHRSLKSSLLQSNMRNTFSFSTQYTHTYLTALPYSF